ATNIKGYLPGVLRVLFTLVKEKKEGHRIDLQPGDYWFQDLMKSGEPVQSAATPDEPAVVLMSGGTTGTPKGVMSDHRSLVIAGTQIATWLDAALQGPDASIMLPLPLFHTYGCAGAQPLALMGGIPLILVPNPRDLDDVVKTIQRDVVAGKVDFRSIRACFSGAAALMAETKKRFEELTGGRIVEGYSLTES